MCKVGDILLIRNYIHNGQNLKRHSFVVLDDKAGIIQGLEYDLVTNVMSSFKDEEHRKKKMDYSGNFPITHDDSNVVNGNDRDGYIKTDQFYYFNKDKTDFTVIGSLNPDIFNLLLEFIKDLEQREIIIDNL